MAGLKLLAEVGLDGSGFETGIKRLEGMAHGFATGLKSFVVQAIGVLTVEQAISKTVETAKELINTSKRLSIAPEQLQLMRQGAKDASIELEDVTKFIEKIDVAREKALRRGPEGMQIQRSFSALGVSPEMLHTMTGAQLLMGPLAKTAQNRSPEEIGALFKSLGGLKDFGAMIPFLKTNFEELGKKMKEFGGIMSSEDAIALKMFSDTLELGSQIIISALAPALTQFAFKVMEVIGKVYAGFQWMASMGKAAFAELKLAALVVAREIITLFPGGSKTKAVKNIDAESAKLLEQIGTGPGLSAAQDKAAVKYDETTNKWTGMIDGLKKKIAEDAEKLRHPKAPDFTTSSLPEKISPKTLESHADSMTKVGNFLGGMGIAGQIEQKKVNLLTRIATGIETLTGKNKPAGAASGSASQQGGFDKIMQHGTNFPHS